MTNKKDAEKLAEPLLPSAERSKGKGLNPHPVKPEDREPTPTGNTLATDNLVAAYAAKNAAEANIKRLEETADKQKNDPLYQRDQKIFEMTRSGVGLPPTTNVDTSVPTNAQHVIMHNADELGKKEEVDPEKQAEEDLKKLQEYEKIVKERKLTAEEETDRATRKSRSEKRNTTKK